MERTIPGWRIKYAGTLAQSASTADEDSALSPIGRRLVKRSQRGILIGHQSVPLAIRELGHDDPTVPRRSRHPAGPLHPGTQKETAQELPALSKGLEDPDAAVRRPGRGRAWQAGAAASKRRAGV